MPAPERTPEDRDFRVKVICPEFGESFTVDVFARDEWKARTRAMMTDLKFSKPLAGQLVEYEVEEL